MVLPCYFPCSVSPPDFLYNASISSISNLSFLISPTGFLPSVSLYLNLYFPPLGHIYGPDHVFKGQRQSQSSRPIEHKSAAGLSANDDGSLFLQLGSAHGKRLPRFANLPETVLTYLVQYLKQQDSQVYVLLSLFTAIH